MQVADNIDTLVYIGQLYNTNAGLWVLTRYFEPKITNNQYSIDF